MITRIRAALSSRVAVSSMLLSALRRLPVCALVCAATLARAQEAPDFLRGRTITIVVGSDAGAGHDAYGRLVGRHFGKHAPGGPNVIVQNQPGAGSLTMVNALAVSGAKDGSVIGAPQSSVAFERLLHILSPGGGAAQFDAMQINWLGVAAQDTFVALGWSKGRIRTTADFLTQDFVVSASGPNTDGYLVVTMLNKLLGARIRPITGYKGTGPQLLALERGEVDGAAMSFSTVAVQRPNLLRDKEIVILLQVGRERHGDLPDVPLLSDFMKTEEDRLVLSLIFDKYQMGRSFFLPPGVPQDRVEALRRAFDATMKDPALLAEAAAQKLEINPLSGAQAQALVARLYAAPDHLVRKARNLLAAAQ